MHKLTALLTVLLLTATVFLMPASAQDVTPEPTDETTPEVTIEPTKEVTLEPTDETTPEVTLEPTDETTPEVTLEPTDETTPEVTTEPTDETTPEVTPEITATVVNREGSINISDQLALDGKVVVDNIASPRAGWIGIHLNFGGQPGPVVGIAPVPAGVSENVEVPIDVLGATSSLFAVLHAETNQVGVFEFNESPAADALMVSGGVPIGMPFKLTSIASFDQQPFDNQVVVASVIWDSGGWLVVHADEGGQPGAVLGQTLVRPGTSANVVVQLSDTGITPVVWPMLHVDDNAFGTFEFGALTGADLPVEIDGQVATSSLNLTTQPVVVTTDGTPLTLTGQPLPNIDVSDQVVFGVGTTNATTLAVNSTFSGGPGWLDVHADAGNHPGVSLGATALPDGITGPSTVLLDPEDVKPSNPPFITPIIWPMLHTDSGQPGVYEFMVIPGADLPVVVNGAIMTYPVNITGAPPVTAEPTDDTTPEVTLEPTDEITPEVTAEPTDDTTPEVTLEPTDETTPEVTIEPTDETTPEVTLEPTDEVTPEVTVAVES